MSGREWKPGDVADVVGTDRTYRGIYVDENCLLGCAIRNAPHWHAVGGSMRADMYEARPLVVIDPEDREQVERFREIASRWADQVPYSDMAEPGDMDHADAMQNALREYLAPPKPDEPTGLGAVVEDTNGDYWIYTGTRNDGDRRLWQHGRDRISLWSNIAAVRVLSEGVTP